MKFSTLVAATLLAALAATPAAADGHGAAETDGATVMGAATLGALTISGAHVRLILPSRPAAAYLKIDNAGEADRLIGVSSEAFGRAELHSHEMQDDLMRMVEVEVIEAPMGGAAVLRSGGDHVMLFDLQRRLAVGDHVPLTLTFEKAGVVSFSAPILPVAESGDPTLGHGATDHGAMDHGATDHGAMDHGATDHGAMDHGGHGAAKSAAE